MRSRAIPHRRTFTGVQQDAERARDRREHQFELVVARLRPQLPAEPPSVAELQSAQPEGVAQPSEPAAPVPTASQVAARLAVGAAELAAAALDGIGSVEGVKKE